MRAIVYHQYGSPDVLQASEQELPSIGATDLLVEVDSAGLNPKDCLVRKGKFRRFTGKRFPLSCGYDFSGRVVEVGGRVKRFQAGDRVFGMLNGWLGFTCAEFVCVPEEEVCKVPKGLSMDEAAGLSLAALTALQALRDLGRIRSGHRVCINGASGGVGSFAVQIARALGGEVTAVCSGRNAQMVRDLGATTVLDYTQGQLPEEQKNAFDLFFDVFGNKSFSKARPSLVSKGIYISTVPSLNILAWQLGTLLSAQKAKLVVVRSKWKDLEALAEFVRSGQLRVLVDSRFALQECAEAHRRIETKRAQGKVIVQVRPEEKSSKELA